MFFNLYLCWCVCIADHVGLGAYENREKANFPDMQSKKWWSLHMDYQSYEKNRKKMAYVHTGRILRIVLASKIELQTIPLSLW